MSKITYSVIGPGSSSDNSIKVNIGCETNALICWVGRTRFQDSETCTDSYRDETYCSNANLPGGYTPPTGTSYNGAILWQPEEGETILVYYTVNRVCPLQPPPICTYKCSNGSLTAYPVPAFVPEDYAGDIDIHYTYTRVCESGEYVGSVEPINGVETVPFNRFRGGKYTLAKEGCEVEVIVGNKEEDDCTPGERADISISFGPKVVPSTGAKVTVIVLFKKTVTDANCNKKITSGSFSLPWEVKCEGTEEEPYKCCEDHYVTTSITKSDIITKAKLSNDAKIYYEGKLVTGDEIQYKILMKAKITDECENYCQSKTTYGVIKDTVKVCYEDGFMTNKWLCEGEATDCDCSALSIEGYNGSYAVPYTGGRIKVSWGYVAHTINNDCSDYFTEGIWEEIIPIGGCDERPKNCTYDLVFNDGTTCTKKKNEGDGGICEGDCKCDAECCYDYDGKGNCKCIIYFKEQFPEFNKDLCDNKKSKLTVYKCTKCGAITTTKSDGNCNNPAPPKDKEGHEFCPSCHSTGDDVFVNPIVFDMSNGQPDGEGGLIYNKVTYNFVQDCTPVCGEYTKTITYTKQTKEYQACDNKTETFSIPYTATINYDNPQCKDTTAKGEELVTIKISPNESSSPRTIIDDERIKITQAAGPCHSECSCDALVLEGEDGPEPGPTPPGPTPPGPIPTDCNGYIKAFETAVGHTFSPDESTYTYLCKLYAEAREQFDGGTEEGLPILYKEENFPNVYNYYGSKGTEENAFATLVGWLFALQLAELKPKNRVAIFKTGYELGGYTRKSEVFGYKFKTDPNVARLVASGIYAAMRGKMSPNISTMRTEVGGTKYSKTIDDYRSSTITDLNSAAGIQKNVISENGYYTDLREFMPSAPGPYAPRYTSRPSYIIPDEKEEFGNTKVDRAIYEYIVQNYNLNSTDITKKKMAVQAVADKETCNDHLFGDNKTVEDGSETYTFHPVFGVDTIGVRLNTTGNLPNLINAMLDTGSRYRTILLSPYVNPAQYGRLRPGCSWYEEYKKNSTTDDRRNELCNQKIENGDGCVMKDTYKTYNSNGEFVGYTFVQGGTRADYCEAQKISLPANSYPSGHSSGMWCGALTLIELMPDKADKIMKSANQYAVNRTIARWHWTSDTINGRVLGSAGNSIAHAASDYDTRYTKAKNNPWGIN